jgi:hypothetical protein
MSSASSTSTHEHGDAIELLALVATLMHSAFARFAADAVDAPSVGQRLELSRMSSDAVARRDRILARVTDLGGDPVDQLERFERLLADLDARTQPATWWERLLKGYVGYGVSEDFCRMAAWGVDPVTRDLVLDVLGDDSEEELSVAVLADACELDEALSSRLALWGRRVVGESLQTVSRMLTVHPIMARIAAKGLLATRTDTEGEQPKVLNELTAEHSRRMSRLKLTA